MQYEPNRTRLSTINVDHFFIELPDKLGEEDKRLHLLWSFWLTIAACILWPVAWAFTAVFLLGLAKECWDSRFGSGFCFFDMFANLLGSSLALIFTRALPGALFA